MKKLALKFDDLQVDSFDTTPPGAALRGTVQGRDDSLGDTVNCYQWTGANYRSCAPPCAQSEMTNCGECGHLQTGISFCPDQNSECFCG